MNIVPGINSVVSHASDKELGSVEVSPILRMMRPATFALWIVMFALQLQTVIATGEQGNWLILALSTVLFGGVHLQYWYEESERGRQVHRNLQRLRGRMYEDEETGLPNSRHFVFELRRQMMRSVRSGHGFSLILADLMPGEGQRLESALMPAVARTLRQGVGEGDFVARLQGSIFAAIVLDEREQTAADKADDLEQALSSTIPALARTPVRPVVSISGYQGELEVRDFLRRAQRDLEAIKGRESYSAVATLAKQRALNASVA